MQQSCLQFAGQRGPDGMLNLRDEQQVFVDQKRVERFPCACTPVRYSFLSWPEFARLQLSLDFFFLKF